MNISSDKMAGGNRRKQTNKLDRAQSRRKPNPVQTMRANPGRVRLAFDGQNLHGTQFYPSSVCIANVASTAIPIDCSNTAVSVGAADTYGAAQGLSTVTGLYNEFVYNAIQFTWIPHVAPGVADGGSPIYVAYIDNPEQMATAAVANANAILVMARSCRNVQTYSAWQKFTYSPPLSRRLPVFNVNTNNAYSVDTVQRSVQGMVLFAMEGITAVADLGQIRSIYDIDLRKLNVTQTT